MFGEITGRHRQTRFRVQWDPRSKNDVGQMALTSYLWLIFSRLLREMEITSFGLSELNEKVKTNTYWIPDWGRPHHISRHYDDQIRPRICSATVSAKGSNIKVYPVHSANLTPIQPTCPAYPFRQKPSDTALLSVTALTTFKCIVSVSN